MNCNDALKMKSNRKTALFFGLLIIFSFICGIFSSVPALEKADYIEKLTAIELHVLIAVFFQALMATVYTGIAVLLYPIIKEYNPILASGYLGFRIIGSGFLFAGIGTLLLLLWLSQSYIGAIQPDQLHFYITGELLRRGRDVLNHICMILPWSIGGMILYFCLYKLRLVSRWLSIWGIIGSAFTLIATVLLMLNLITLTNSIYFILNAPIVFCELVLAIVLIVRGFNSVKNVENRRVGKI